MNGPPSDSFRHGGLAPLVGQMSTDVFRSLLRTVSRPGTIEMVRPTDQARVLYGEALAILAIPALALANVDVKLCALGGVPSKLVGDIAAATDASISECALADLILGDRFTRPEELRQLRTGTATDPHLSARLCIQVDEICEVAPADLGKDDGSDFEEFDLITSAMVDPDGLDPVTIDLRGPGIKSAVLLRIHGLPTSVLEGIVELNRSFPVGVDTHFISRHGELVSIPRTTRLRVVPIEKLRVSKRSKSLLAKSEGM
jgi:alpha-D-ribose 1-methylphosphonate 5-triphosphate synthase subunit PhnH